MGEKISALPSGVVPLAGTELVPIVQSGATVAVAASAVGNAATGTRPIATGGTNTTSQTTNGVAFYNGSSITTGSALTWNGTLFATSGGIRSSSSSQGIGYATGAGTTVTQTTNRTTGVTINAVCGEITLVSAAGSASYATFTVSNSAVVATDRIILNQKSGADLYILLITATGAGSFNITFATTGGTTVAQPVIGFTVIKGTNA